MKHQKKWGCQHQMRNFSQQSRGFHNYHSYPWLVKQADTQLPRSGIINVIKRLWVVTSEIIVPFVGSHKGNFFAPENCTAQRWLTQVVSHRKTHLKSSNCTLQSWLTKAFMEKNQGASCSGILCTYVWSARDDCIVEPMAFWWFHANGNHAGEVFPLIGGLWNRYINWVDQTNPESRGSRDYPLRFGHCWLAIQF